MALVNSSDFLGLFYTFLHHWTIQASPWHLRSRDHQGTSWFSQSTSMGCGAPITRMPWPRRLGENLMRQRSYNLVNIQKTMENHHFDQENPWKIHYKWAIFNSLCLFTRGYQMFSIYIITYNYGIQDCRSENIGNTCSMGSTNPLQWSFLLRGV